jgi:hypothetical protein
MRDDRTFWDDCYQEQGYVSNGIVTGSTTHHPIKTRTFRSDSTPTQPVGATYVDATEYDAFFSFISHREYGYTRDGRFYKGKASSHQPFPNALAYGCAPTYPHAPDIPGALISKCESIVLSKVRNNDFDLGVALGELPETLAFVADTVVSAARLFRAIKRRNAGEARNIVEQYFVGSNRTTGSHPSRVAKGAASAYLQYQYAWKPMMSDIYSACKLQAEGLEETEAFRVSHAEEDSSYSSSELDWYGINSLHNTTIGTKRRGVEVGLSFAVASETLYDLNRLGLLNPLAIAWELVPLSFVFDWFVPVGNFLKSLSIGIGTKFKTGYQTLWLKNRLSCSWVPNSHGDAIGTWPSIALNTTSMQRTLLNTFPIPLPYPKLDLDTSKLLSGLALIVASRP